MVNKNIILTNMNFSIDSTFYLKIEFNYSIFQVFMDVEMFILWIQKVKRRMEIKTKTSF
ncbi:hypothetical protein CLW00_1204 [Mongoliibacter ruber]|uniref:Uncharacterized protein n=1 Tax=Mongoliibacter ruber TaxID=1750599 RepID=A0A2T0WCM1_9BACT|nr:hypothetical protein CLW00_1204 [Mongoliibacter ruber]